MWKRWYRTHLLVREINAERTQNSHRKEKKSFSFVSCDIISFHKWCIFNDQSSFYVGDKARSLTRELSLFNLNPTLSSA